MIRRLGRELSDMSDEHATASIQHAAVSK